MGRRQRLRDAGRLARLSATAGAGLKKLPCSCSLPSARHSVESFHIHQAMLPISPFLTLVLRITSKLFLRPTGSFQI